MARDFSAWKSPKGLKKIAELYGSGMSYTAIAKKIGCDRKTLNRWLNNTTACPTMRQQMQEAAIDACKPLEDAAWKAAQGFEYEERTYRPDEGGNMVLVEKKVKYSAPQPMLLQFLLKNKKPDEYKDKQEIQTDGTVTIRFDGGAGGADWDEISG
jgi:hypothetical protein